MKNHETMQQSTTSHGAPYRTLAIMLVLNTLIMFVLMFEMIAQASDFVVNLNMAYMALMMAAPMAILEIAMMGGMYPNRRANLITGGVAALVLIGSFLPFALKPQLATASFSGR